MAPTTLAEALAQMQYAPTENFYGYGAQAIGAATPLLSNPYQSTGKNLAYTIGAGLVAGLLGGMAKRQAAEENAQLYSLGSQFIRSDDTQRKDLLKTEPRLVLLGNALRDREINRQFALEDYKAQTPLMIERERGLTRAKIQAENEAMLGAVGGSGATSTTTGESTLTPQQDRLRSILSIPKEFRGEATKELALFDNVEKVKSHAKKWFEEAKTLTGADAFIGRNTPIPTKSGDALRGGNKATMFFIDTTIGREVNDKVREELDALLPRSFDSNETIEQKKAQFVSLLEGISKSTPVLDMYGAKKSISSSEDSEAKKKLIDSIAAMQAKLEGR